MTIYSELPPEVLLERMDRRLLPGKPLTLFSYTLLWSSLLKNRPEPGSLVGAVEGADFYVYQAPLRRLFAPGSALPRCFYGCVERADGRTRIRGHFAVSRGDRLLLLLSPLAIYLLGVVQETQAFSRRIPLWEFSLGALVLFSLAVILSILSSNHFFRREERAVREWLAALAAEET